MSHRPGQPATGALPPGQGRDALVEEVRRVLDGVLASGAAAVVAVSGGPDSTALAFLTRSARADLDGHVVHVRHGLRDDAADAAVAAEHAAALGWPFHERRVDVDAAGEGVAAAARRARYEALADVAGEVGAPAVLVGHTADDQAETVVLNLARGAGLAGLAGMDAVTRRERDDVSAPAVDVVRPLLRVRRRDVHAFVADEGLATVADPTNRDPARRRVRAREEALPALARLSGGTGDPVGALTRLADLARADAEALDQLADAEASRLVARWGPGRAVRDADLDALPRALAARVVRATLTELAGAVGVDAATVDRVDALRPGQSCHAPGGVWVTRGGGWLAALPAGAAGLAARPLSVPGTTPLPELGLVVRAEAVPAGEGGVAPPAAGPSGLRPPGAEGPAAAVVPAGDPLVVRPRRHGDRLAGRLLGDLLAEAGVPRGLRDLVPVVADPDGTPRWIPGVARAEAAPGEASVRLWLAPLG